MTDEKDKKKKTFIPIVKDSEDRYVDGLMVSEDGSSVARLHRAGNKEGLTQVHLEKIEGSNPRAYTAQEVETVYERESKGPAKVSTNAYRNGWERIFGGKADSSMN